jgi:hypothetical protein
MFFKLLKNVDRNATNYKHNENHEVMTKSCILEIILISNIKS